jgi:hypothetical protein
MQQEAYPVQFSVDYPDRPLERVSTAFRIFAAIPILIILIAIASGRATAGGVLFLGTLLMIVFREKYPRWWFDWNLQISRFENRIFAYLALMDDRYPATDEEQSVHLDLSYPDVPKDLNRWLPLIKWLLAIPHYIALILLYVALIVSVIIVWFVIVFTGAYPRGLFDFAEGVFRWSNRVSGYAFLLVTDVYPPFRLRP